MKQTIKNSSQSRFADEILRNAIKTAKIPDPEKIEVGLMYKYARENASEAVAEANTNAQNVVLIDAIKKEIKKQWLKKELNKMQMISPKELDGKASIIMNKLCIEPDVTLTPLEEKIAREYEYKFWHLRFGEGNKFLARYDSGEDPWSILPLPEGFILSKEYKFLERKAHK